MNKALKPSDCATYRHLLIQYSEGEQDEQGRKRMARLVEKALQCSESRAQYIEAKRAASYFRHFRVRHKEMGLTGTVAPFRNGDFEPLIGVLFDGVDLDVPLPFQAHELTTLCEVCDNEATFRCARCRCRWYCGKDCQSKHWKEHKSVCQPFCSSRASRRAQEPRKVISKGDRLNRVFKP